MKRFLASSLATILLLSGCQSQSSSDSDVVSDVSATSTTTGVASDSSDLGLPVIDLGAIPDAPSVSILDATEAVDPAQLWGFGGAFYSSGGVCIFEGKNASGEYVTFKMQGDEDIISVFHAILQLDKAAFVPEYTVLGDYHIVSSLKIYDAEGNPQTGLVTEEAVKNWEIGLTPELKAEMASATPVWKSSVRLSTLEEGVLYKSDKIVSDFYNDIGEDCILMLAAENFDGWKTEFMPVVDFPDRSVTCSLKSHFSDEDLESSIYFKIDKAGAEAKRAEIIADNSACVTVSQLRSGEYSDFKEFIYNDTSEDATVLYQARSVEQKPAVIKVGELMSLDWTLYVVVAE